ncbi:MAG: FGGY family carbohydrate kinase, partial [Thermomicrobium sp.]|nr:FGGY family carbohydrate kinase [Thermomicrobium sp.]
PVSMWADTRASEAAARLRGVLDVDAHHRRTGAYLHPSYPVARLAWLRDTQPSWWDRTRFWCAFPDYLLARWTGDLVTSVSMASGTGLFDTDRLAWDEETCATLGMQTDRLPIVDDRPRRLARAYRARWPHFASAVWYPAWGDGACSNVGSGAVGTDRATVTIGTSSAVRVLWRGVPIHTPWGTWLYRLDRETVLIGGALSEGGDLVDWIRRRFVLPTEPELWDAVLAAPFGAGGLRWIPTIAGERSPRWPIDAVATLTGLRLGHDGVLVLRAAMEAIACRLARIVELLRPVNPSIETFIGSGNALLGTPGWAQLVADALGHPLVLAPDPEASLRGAALVALARLTEQPVEQLARQPVVGWQRLEPSPAATAFFRRLSAEMARLEQALAAAQDSPVTDVT